MFDTYTSVTTLITTIMVHEHYFPRLGCLRITIDYSLIRSSDQSLLYGL